MQIQKFETNEEWLEARSGRITGTKLKDIIVKRGTGKKVGFYQLIADRLAIVDDEDPMQRGHRLEVEAIERLTEDTGITFNTDLVIISRDDNSDIAWSPDGYTEDMRFGAEVKCLKSALHLQAFIEHKIPYEYVEQSIQPFIVNDKLEKLYFVFYDPRIMSKPFHFIEINRDDVAEEVEDYKELEEKTLIEVNAWVQKLAW